MGDLTIYRYTNIDPSPAIPPAVRVARPLDKAEPIIILPGGFEIFALKSNLNQGKVQTKY